VDNVQSRRARKKAKELLEEAKQKGRGLIDPQKILSEFNGARKLR
jgi:hypothetical protein